jgi:hypothetical protein
MLDGVAALGDRQVRRRQLRRLPRQGV